MIHSFAAVAVKAAKVAFDWIYNHSGDIKRCLVVVLTAAVYGFGGFLSSIVAASLWSGTNGDADSQAALIGIIVAGAAGFSLVGYLLRVGRSQSRYAVAGSASLAPRDYSLMDHDGKTLSMVAEHEACHAVVAAALGHKVTSIHTKPNGSKGGGTNIQIRDGLSLTEIHWHQVLFYLAPVGINVGHSQTDDSSVFSHLNQIIGRGVRPEGVDCDLNFSDLHSEAVAKSKSLVADNAAGIHALAEALVEHRTLRGEELVEAMRSAMG